MLGYQDFWFVSRLMAFVTLNAFEPIDHLAGRRAATGSLFRIVRKRLDL
jgi:hypothetical protein